MKRLAAGAAVTCGEMEIIPIELVRVGSDRLGDGLAFFALKEPVAVIIRSPRGEWAFKLAGPGDPSLSDLLLQAAVSGD